MERTLIITSLMGYGDLLYMTPFVRFLKNIGMLVDVWTINHEPFRNNSSINKLYIMKTKQLSLPVDAFYKHTLKFLSFDNTGSNNHTIDYYTRKALNFTLRNKEKELELNWHPKDEAKVLSLMGRYDLHQDKGKSNFVIISPTINWPSRTLSLKFYQDLIKKIQANGDKVVLVGKEISRPTDDPRMSTSFQEQEKKSLYATDDLGSGLVDFTNLLSLHETAALYSFCKVAINTENGNMVLSNTNYNCWNVYIPTLTAPEYRLPWRKGSQCYKSIVVSENDYYPASDYSFTNESRNLCTVDVQYPSIEKVYNAYLTACDRFSNNDEYYCTKYKNP